jgi:signal transduction histidine kinase
MSLVRRENFTVRVLRGGSAAPAGVGFVVGSREVITCAHVINVALGRPIRDQTLPGAEARVQVDFPMLGDADGGPSRSCKVVTWVPPSAVGVRGGDVAGLELVGEDLPAGAVPARLVITDARDIQVSLYGFPGNPPRRFGGALTTCWVRGAVGGGALQLDSAGESAIRVQPGYSGSPAVVAGELADAVVGMLAIAGDDESSRDAYAIPASQLIDAWPDLLGYLTVPNCPYPGLQPFSEQAGDTGLFLGREQEIAQLRQFVKRQPLVIVTGPSGVGKTSLISAGLIPALRTEGWAAATFRPGGLPFEGLARALIDVENPGRTVTSDDVGKRLHQLRAGGGLRDIGSQISAAVGAPVLIHVDQFEEIFDPHTTDFATCAEFLDMILPAYGVHHGQLCLVCTLRVDFLSYLLNHPEAGNRLQERFFALSAMGTQQLERIIVEPAMAMGVTYEDGLPQLIARDGTGSGGLPLLEFALEELWPHQRQRRINLTDYQAIGGVTGALARHAEQAFTDLTRRFNVDGIRRVMLNLVRSRAGASQATRRIVTRDHLGADWPIAEDLAKRRLLVLDHDPSMSADTAELAHEALIQAWPRLGAWVDADVDFRRWLTVMEDRADDDLLSGSRLSEATRWQSERPDDIPARVAVLIALSRSEQLRRMNELRDATEAMELRNAEDLMVAIGDQASTIIHGLNNTVGAMRMYIIELQEMQQAGEFGPSETLNDSLDRIRDLVERTLQMPSEILRFLDQEVADVDVNGAILKALERIRIPGNITIDIYLDPELPLLSLYSFEEVIEDLLRNAIDAMPTGGTLSISTSLAAEPDLTTGYIHVVVRDTGAGIPDDIMPHIFDLHFTTKHGRGRRPGSGLWWDRNFVRRSRGDIFITSAVNAGSEVVVKIPVTLESRLDTANSDDLK